MKKTVACLLAVLLVLASFTVSFAETKTLYANTGPVEFFYQPWFNPGQYVTQKVLWDRLIACDADMNPTDGQMAESYGFNDAGDVLTFVLRDGITWHDGEPITAQDVKWSIEYALKTAALHTVFAGTFKAIAGADEFIAGTASEISGVKIDGKTIEITFSKVAPDALLTFTQWPPLPQKYFEGEDPMQFQQAAYFQNPVGSGPFKVKEVAMNNYCVLEPFEGYWNGVANFEIQLNASSAEADANLVVNAMAGKIDYAYTKTYTDVQALRDAPGLTVNTVNVKYTRMFWANKFPGKDGSPSPLADPRVRQAIAYALDMEAVCETIFEGASLPANSLTPDGGSKIDGLNLYSYDPEKAKALLAEAGWDPSTVLDVVYYYTDQQTVDLMAICQQYLAQVGIQMNARLVEGNLDELLWSKPADPVNGPSAVDWDMCYAAVSAMSLHEYYDRCLKDTGVNSHTPYDPVMEELINATNASMDATVQQEAFFALQQYENEFLPNIPLYYQPVWVVESDAIKGNVEAYGNPQYCWDWGIQNWEINR